ncbi:MAG: GspE/PulE family protein [bacterium]
MSRQKPNFEELLLEHGLLKPAQLEHVQRLAIEQKKTLEEVIRAEKLVFPEPLAQLKAAFLGVPYVDLKVVEIDDTAMSGISQRAATTYQFVAFGQQNGKLQVAMASPDDYQVLEAVRFIASRRSLIPELYCASPENIEAVLRAPSQNNIKQTLRDFGQEVLRAENVPRDKDKLHDVLVSAPINKIVAVIIRLAIEGLASDVHIEPGNKEFRVRYRIDHQLSTTLLLPMESLPAITSRIKILSNVRVSQSNLPQQGRFVLPIDGQSYSIHASFMPTVAGERVTLRLIDISKPAPTLSELGLSNTQLDLVKKHLSARDGLIIVAGPAGSGKATFLFTALSLLNKSDVNIATLEDPVEYEISGINQTQLQSAQGLTATVVLQNLLQQDIDIIMVSKLFDSATAGLVVKAAANHLILSTCHASDAISTISHLINLDLGSHLVASSLRLLVAQRLVPKLCQACALPEPIPRELKLEIQAELKNISKATRDELRLPRKLSFSSSAGCPACHERKTQGQIGLFEVVPVFQELRTAIANKDDCASLVPLIRRKGHLSLRQDGLLKALAGLVSYRDVISATS